MNKLLGTDFRRNYRDVTRIFCTAALGLTLVWPACGLLAEGGSPEDDLADAPREFTVTSVADSGPGSLRAALELAQESLEAYRIVFGTAEGPFSVPQVIELSSPLPIVQTEVEIDGFIPGLLWKSYGVTVSGNDQFRVFEVAPDGELRLSGITVSNGQADQGAGILNRGRLVVEGVTLLENHATEAGGAIANEGGEAFIINSTAYRNSAESGGAVANLAGSLRLTHVSLHENQAETGSAVFSRDILAVNNSMFTGEPIQCVNEGLLAESGHNMFSYGLGCGEAIISGDPKLGSLGYYNGPTRTIPISADSPARNLGDRAASVDHEGAPLKWDQRGNGDPRDTRGYVDIGAFEHQSQLPTEYVVDTIEDNLLRVCSKIGQADCSLRAAIELSLAGRHLVTVRFDPEIFSSPQVLWLEDVPDNADQPLVIDGEGTGGVVITVPEAVPWRGVNGAKVEFSDSGATAKRN